MNEPALPPDPTAPGALPRSVKVVGLASLLNDTASEMIYPLLPHFLLTVLIGNRFHLGVIEGIADAVASFLKLWSGDQSDQAGRRKQFIVFGYCVPALVRPLMALAAAPWHLFAIRVLDRIGKGVRSAPRDALIADATDESGRGRAFGFQRAMDNFGAAIGPLLAAGFLWFWPDEMRTLFLLAILPGVLVVVLLVMGLRETPGPQSRPERGRLTLAPFDRPFRVYLVALVFFTLGNSSDAFLLVRAGELGVSTAMLPLLWCACHIAKSSSNLILGRVVDRFGARSTLVVGWVAFGGIYLAFGLAENATAVWAAFIGYGIACGLIEPAERALVAQLVGTERKGLAYGWYNFAVGIATLPSSLIFGAVYHLHGPLPAFAWGAFLAGIAALCLFGLVRPMNAKGQNGPPGSLS